MCLRYIHTFMERSPDSSILLPHYRILIGQAGHQILIETAASSVGLLLSDTGLRLGNMCILKCRT